MSASTNKELNLKNLIEALETVSARWSDLGLQLGFSQDDLDDIEGDHTRGQTRLRIMLNKWLERTLYKSWEDIYYALKKMKRLDLTKKIATDHGLSPTAHVRGQSRVCLGKDASLSCIAQGKPPLNYQWYKDDQPVQKACFESFHIQSLSKTSEGIYHCKVTNDFDSVKSNKVDLIIGKEFEATHLLTVLNLEDTDMDTFFQIATHLAKEDRFAIFYKTWKEQEPSCSWKKLAEALKHVKKYGELINQCKKYQETEFSEKKFCELIGGIGKVDAKELKKHLIPSADVGEESAAALFKEWKKFKPHTCNWDMLSKALVEMKADETTISVAESYIGIKCDQVSFSRLLQDSKPTVKLEELGQKLKIKDSPKFRSSFIKELKIWDDHAKISNPKKAWIELAASIESIPATIWKSVPKQKEELYYSVGTELRAAAGVGLGVSDENLRKVCEYAECDDTCKLKVIVQNLLQEGMIKRAWNYLWTEDPYKKMMNEWKKLSWESLARAAEQLATNGCLFAQKIREFSGAGGYPEVASVYKDLDEEKLETGKKVTFTCRARGAAPLHYTWMRDGEPLPGQQKPEMTLTVTKGGNYCCVVENELGSKKSGLIEIKVGKRPKCCIYFKEKECGSSLCIKRQSKQVKLTCKVIEGSPDFEFTWKFNGVKKQGVKEDPKHYSLEIGEATEDNKGTYKCTVSNGIGQPHTSEVEVDVGDPPEIKVTEIEGIKRSNFEVKTEVTICCEATGTAPLGYTWWQWHSNHTMRTEHQGGAKLKVVTAEDKEGDYECEVSNKFGVATSTPPVKIRVGSAPVIKSKPRIDGELMHGKRVTLSCKAEEGKLPIKFEWLLNNQLLEKAALNKRKESELVIESLSDSDQGEYKCKAFNAFGFDVSSSVQLELSISHGAIMPLIEEKVAAKWYAFGLLLGVPKDTLDSIARGYVASCGNTKYALSEVVRDWLEDKHTQESSKPKSWSSLQEVVGKMGYHKLAGDIESKEPSIRSIMTNEVVKLKNPVTISCEASGWDIGYEWKHNGTTLVKETQKDLVIESMTEQHQGTYQCCVQNRFGKDKNSIDLRFNGKPNKIIKDPKKKKNNAEGQVATKHTTEEMEKYFQKLCEEIKKILNQTTGTKESDHDTAFSSGWASLYLITKDMLVPEEREKIQDINSLFDVFSPYWNFRRLHLLKTIVIQFGNETAEEKMDTYSQQLSDYEAYTTVHQFTCALERGKITLPAVPDSVSQFSFTLESLWSSCFVKDVDRLLSYLLPSQVSHDFVLFSNAKMSKDGGSHITVNYLVSKSMAEALTTGVTEKSSIFSSSGMLSVKVNDCPIEPKVIQPVHPQLIGLPLPTAQEPEPKEEQPTPKQVQQLQDQLDKLSEIFYDLEKKVDSHKEKFQKKTSDLEKNVKGVQEKNMELITTFSLHKADLKYTRKVSEDTVASVKRLDSMQEKMQESTQNSLNSTKSLRTKLPNDLAQVKREMEAMMDEKIKSSCCRLEMGTEHKKQLDEHKKQIDKLEKKQDKMKEQHSVVTTDVAVLKQSVPLSCLAEILEHVKKTSS